MASRYPTAGKTGIKSVKYTIFQANVDTLVVEVKKALIALAKKAKKNGLVDDETFTVLQNQAFNVDVRASLLIDAVLDKVDQNGSNFDVFVSVLQDIPVLNSATEQLTGALTKAYRFRSPAAAAASRSRPTSSQPSRHDSQTETHTRLPSRTANNDSGIIDILSETSASASAGSTIRLEPATQNVTQNVTNTQTLQSLLNPTQASSGTHVEQSQLVAANTHTLTTLGNTNNLPRTDLQGRPIQTQSISSNDPSPSHLELDNTALQPSAAPLEEGGIEFEASEQESQPSIQETGQNEGKDLLLVQNGQTLASRSDSESSDLYSAESVLELRKRIEHLRNELHQTKSESQQKEADICDLKETIEQLLTKIDDLLQQLEDNKKQVDRITSTKDAEINSLKEEFESQKIEFTKLQNQLAEKEIEKVKLSEAYEGKVAELAEYQAATQAEMMSLKKEHEESIRKLKETLKKTNIQKGKAEIALAQLREQLAIKELDKANELAALNKEKHKLEIKIRDLQIDLGEKEKLLLKKDKLIAEKCQQLAEKDKQKAEEDKQRAEEDKQKAEQNLDDQRQVNNQLHEEVQELRRQLSQVSLNSQASLPSETSRTSLASISENSN